MDDGAAHTRGSEEGFDGVSSALKAVAKFFRDIPRHDGHAVAVAQLDRFDIEGRQHKTSSKDVSRSFKDAFAWLTRQNAFKDESSKAFIFLMEIQI